LIGTQNKRCYNWVRTHKRPPIRLSEQAPEAGSDCTLGARLSVQSSALHNFFTGLNHFSPKNPNFDLPTSKFVPKDCLQVHVLKRAFKNTSKMKSNIISTQSINSTHFYKNLQQQLNSCYKSEIMNTQGTNHQQQHLITTTTSIKHEFINNPTTTSFFINFEQNTKYNHIYISSMQIQHQQHNYHQIHILKHCIKT